MSNHNVSELLKSIVGGDAQTRASALHTLYTLDEHAVEPLIDEFYAGVNEQTGLFIIEIITTIGGYEARQLLDDIADNPQPYTSWKRAVDEYYNS